MGIFLGVGYGQANLVLNNVSVSWNQIMTFGFEDVPGTGRADLAAASFLSNLTSATAPFQAAKVSTVYTVVRVDTTIMTGTGPIIATAPSGVVGTLANNPPPANCAILISKGTARGGRRGRGRLFCSPAIVDEGNVSPAGNIAGGTLTPIQTAFNAFLALQNASNYPLRLLHSVSEVAPDPVLSLTVQSRMATQRTRMRK